MKVFEIFRRKTDLTEEIESHLKMATADRVGRGESPVDARRAAVRECSVSCGCDARALGMAAPGAAGAGLALCSAPAAQDAGIHDDGAADAGPGHRSQRGDLHAGERGSHEGSACR